MWKSAGHMAGSTAGNTACALGVIPGFLLEIKKKQAVLSVLLASWLDRWSLVPMA